jgi:hypothetical protein
MQPQEPQCSVQIIPHAGNHHEIVKCPNGQERVFVRERRRPCLFEELGRSIWIAQPESDDSLVVVAQDG